MSANLTVVQPIREPNVEALTLARNLLASIERGDYTELCAIARCRDGSCDTLWTSSSDLIQMLAIVTRLQHHIQKRLDKASERP